MQKFYPQLYYHIVWGTRFRRLLITEEIEKPLPIPDATSSHPG